MSHMPEDIWVRTYPTTLMGVMSCYSTDLELGRVVPKQAGQIFHLVDANECWMYLGDPTTEVQKKKHDWLLTIIWAICLAGLAADIFLSCLLFQRLEWLGVI